MLKGPPGDKHLLRLYHELSLRGANCVGEKTDWPYRVENLEELIALGAEMSRYDPRLVGILVDFLFKRGFDLIPQKLRGLYSKMETPETLAVLAEFVKSANSDPETFYFMSYLQEGLKPVPVQLYFKELYAPAGKFMRRAAEESLAQYKKWGFLAWEAPTVDIFTKKTIGRPDLDSRKNILRRLFGEKRQIRLGDYLKELKGSISRQQALKDLAAMADLKGRGRGAVWEMRG